MKGDEIGSNEFIKKANKRQIAIVDKYCCNNLIFIQIIILKRSTS